MISKDPRRSRIVKTFPWFLPSYEGTENMFYFFYKIIIFRLNKEIDDIGSVYVSVYFFNETVNSHNLETANHIAHFRASLLQQTCYPNYFINLCKSIY